jgi:hypothetical protein
MAYDAPQNPAAASPTLADFSCQKDMQKMILTVTTTMTSKHTGAPMWFVFESEHQNLQSIYQALADDGIVIGEKVETVRRGTITAEESRTPLILGVGTVATIVPCHLTFNMADGRVYEASNTGLAVGR